MNTKTTGGVADRAYLAVPVIRAVNGIMSDVVYEAVYEAVDRAVFGAVCGAVNVNEAVDMAVYQVSANPAQ